MPRLELVEREIQIVGLEPLLEEAIRRAALGNPNVVRHLEGRTPKRVIVVPGRLVNIVA